MIVPAEDREKARVFLATPFAPERAGNEDPEIFQRVQRCIVDAVELVGGVLDHPQANRKGGNILEQILSDIDGADVVVGIVSGDNPNVLFEIGYAARRAPILITSVASKLPFDLRIYRAESYGGAGELDSLTARIAEALRQTLAEMDAEVRPSIERYAAAVGRRASVVHGFLPHFVRDKYRQDLAAIFIPPKVQIASSTEDWTRFLALENSDDDGFALLIGSAGSGKSTLMQMLIARAWASPKSIALDRQHLPLFTSARTLASASGASFAERLHAAMAQDRSLAFEEALPAEFIAHWSRKARRPWLIAIDGLDEVPPESAEDFVAWLEQLIDYAQANGHRIVMSSRPNAIGVRRLEQRARVARMMAFDNPSVTRLAETILGEKSGPFLEALGGSRFRERMQSPLLLVLAASVFERTGSMPAKRSQLLDSVIETAIEHARTVGRIEDSVAAMGGLLLERIAAARDRAAETAAVAEVLKESLALPEVEARARAPGVLRQIAQGSGLMMEAENRYLPASLVLFEHLIARGLLLRFRTAIERNVLVEAWSKDRRDLVIAFLGLIENEAEVSTLLRTPFKSWIRRLFQKPHVRFESAAFIVDCLVDGVSVDAKLRREVVAELRALSSNAVLGPRAAEQLGRLGDLSALERWLETETDRSDATAYAVAALFKLGEMTRLRTAIQDPQAPLSSRIAALTVVAKHAGAEILLDVLRDSTSSQQLTEIAVAMLMRERTVLFRALREGLIPENLTGILAAACVLAGELDSIFTAADDPEISERQRTLIKSELPNAMRFFLRDLSRDPALDAKLRIALDWIVDAKRSTPPDLVPLFGSDQLSPAIKFGAAMLVLGIDPRAFGGLVSRRELDMKVRAFALHLLLESEDPNAIDQVLGELKNAARNASLEENERTAAFGLLILSGRWDHYCELIRSDAESGKIAVMLAAKAHAWPALDAVARDGGMDVTMRAVSLQLLSELGRSAELEAFAESERMPDTLRALAHEYLRKQP